MQAALAKTTEIHEVCCLVKFNSYQPTKILPLEPTNVHPMNACGHIAKCLAPIALAEARTQMAASTGLTSNGTCTTIYGLPPLPPTSFTRRTADGARRSNF